MAGVLFCPGNALVNDDRYWQLEQMKNMTTPLTKKHPRCYPLWKWCELFAQQSMRAKWKSTQAVATETIQGLVVEDHLRVLRDSLVQPEEKFHRLAREHIEPMDRLRQRPAVQIERAEAINPVLVARA
jgi:hypothetical protein